MKNKSSIKQILPVMFGFFVMGFVDVVGIASNYIKQDFQLSDTISNLLLMMVYVWFVLFSIPTGVLMSKVGRKNTVVISIVVTALALFVPVFSYSLPTVLLALALLGIGNAILQVSINPLLGDIVPDDKLASNLTFGQFIKAISSFVGPILAGLAAMYFGNWRLLFPLFGAISVLAIIWLNAIHVTESEQANNKVTFLSSFALLLDKKILGLFLGILLVVGIDVGLNVSIPKYLMFKNNMLLVEAGLGTSLYFAAKTVGAFFGAIILTRFSSVKFYTFTVLFAIASLIFTLSVDLEALIYFGVFLLGLSVSNIFSIIFSIALLHKPNARNEISGLMMMGIIGGAVIPFVMGIVSDKLGQTLGMSVLGVCMIYLLVNSFSFYRK